ncbi:tetratricopeptide repeat protein [bacterium SCSIO 12741]|nr:tetratricopeptide repeat protein [bacterium SCSIO 12741]
MKPSLFLFACLFLSGFSSFSCINVYRTTLDGNVHSSDAYRGIVYPKSIDAAKLRLEAQRLEKRWGTDSSYQDLSDYAAALIYLGELEKSKSIYHFLESQRPGSYVTASNLGTIYELLGKPDSAHYWIARSMKINPQSHGGSEWIHLKILEFQLNPDRDSTSSILGLDFGKEGIPENIKGIHLIELRDHLTIQLKERGYFVKPPNWIVGNIYFDYGNVIAQTLNVEAALESYEEAAKFGFHSPLMEKRENALQSLAWRASFKNGWDRALNGALDEILVVAVGGILFLLFLIWVVKWKLMR